MKHARFKYEGFEHEEFMKHEWFVLSFSYKLEMLTINLQFLESDAQTVLVTVGYIFAFLAFFPVPQSTSYIWFRQDRLRIEE